MMNCCLETKCLRCCIDTNMILSYRDIEIIEKLGYKPHFFVTEHDGWLQLKNKNGRCVFHNKTVCSIYSHRPKGCTLYPIVYNKDNNCAVLDSDCPQKHCFPLSKIQAKQLRTFIILLEKERDERKKEKKKKY